MTDASSRAVRRSSLCLLGVLTSLAAMALCAGVARAGGTPEPYGTVVPLISAPPSAAGISMFRDPAQPPVVDPGREFNLVGALVRGPAPLNLGVIVRLRTSLDGQTWSEWLTLEFPRSQRPAGSAFDSRDTVSEPLWIGSARYAQLDVAGSAANAAAVQASLRLACVTSPWDEAAAATGEEPAAGSGGEGSPVERSAAKPTIITRAQWGANESWRNDGPYYGRVRMVFIHHTVSSNSYTKEEAPAIVRSIYYYHAKVNGWNDIGYNFLIDRYGRVYEGRYGGVTRSVIGAQVLGFNTNSFGVSVIGTYTSVKPPAVALTALERLIAWKLDVHHVDPLGYARVRCLDGEKFPQGALVRFNVISGHRQANYTTCPGNGIFNSMSIIRNAVDAIGQPKIYAPSASPAVFSPNGDGERDSSTAVCTLSQAADWKVEVRNDLGEVVRTLNGHGQSVAAEWNGRAQNDAVLPDGAYLYVMSATNATGAARPAQVSVRIDSGAPPVQDVHAAPTPVTPNNDGVGDSTRVLFTLAERCRVRVSLFDAGGALVRRLRDWAPASTGVNAVAWDGTITVGGDRVPAPDGAYKVRVEAMDAAGNRGTGAGSLMVDCTLGFAVAAPLYISPNGDAVQDTSRLSFKLATGAKVTVTLVSGTEELRKWALGDLQKGTHTVTWDGTDRVGTTVDSGRYAFVTSAVNAVGTVMLRVPVRVDRLRPRTTTTVSAATVRVGHALVLKYTVNDRYSPSVRVRIIVTDSAGATVRSALVGWVTSGRARSWSYTPATRGKYTVAVSGTDKAGNRQAAPTKVALTVR